MAVISYFKILLVGLLVSILSIQVVIFDACIQNSFSAYFNLPEQGLC